MPNKQQSTGMTGLYLVAAELSTRGFIVSPTSRSAQAADLLVTDVACKHTYAVQVKTNARSFRAWLVNGNTSEIVAESFVYALVNLTKKGPEFFLVPSSFVSKNVKVSPASATRQVTGYSLNCKIVERYRDNWRIFTNEDNPSCEAAHAIYRPSLIVPVSGD
jgi:hypothetical protein